MTTSVTVELPPEFLEILGHPEGEIGRELLEAAVLRWFEEGRLSQGQASTMLGLKRGDFFNLLNAHQISPVQMTVEDLEEDFQRG
jgi:predicted HTH domain antitoxin